MINVFLDHMTLPVELQRSIYEEGIGSWNYVVYPSGGRHSGWDNSAEIVAHDLVGCGKGVITLYTELGNTLYVVI